MANLTDSFESFDFDYDYTYTYTYSYELTEQEMAEMSQEMIQLAADDITLEITKQRRLEVANQLEKAKKETELSDMSKIAIFLSSFPC